MTTTEIGSYQVVREIGRGAMGVVLEAQDAEGATVALKLLSLPVALAEADAAALRARFLREGRALSAVEHPHVVRVFEVGEANAQLYLAMEFLDGESLRQLLARVGPLSPERVTEIGEQLLGALDAVHAAGIIHRDVKPENVLVLRDGRIKLADFGVAWMENEATLTRTGGMLGSPAYMSPEQILARPVDHRSDLFSAAATLYQLLMDRLPFPGAGLMELAQNVVYGQPEPLSPAVPTPLRLAIERALAKSADDRFATAGDFALALTRAEVTLREPSPPPPLLPLVVEPVVISVPSPPADAAPEYTIYDRTSRCNRHPGIPAIAHCKACGQAVCDRCTRQSQAPYFCMVHAPITLFGVPLVRYEVALVLLMFILLLLGVGPVGYAILHR